MNSNHRVGAVDDWYLAHVPEGDGPISERRAFLTLGHVLVGIGSEHDTLIGLEDIRVIRHSFNTGE
jgi:hypothetical protein